ncbi:alanine aminotransferase 2-like [Lissotriton helveticus]
MAAGQGKVLTPGRLHRRITDLKVPAIEDILKQAAVIKQELALGVEKPFQELIPCYSEDHHTVGQKPITFIRQVAAVCAYPELLNSVNLPEDVKQRARSLLEELDGGTIGGYNIGYAMRSLPNKVAKYIERRDGGVPASPNNVIISWGSTRAILSLMSFIVTEEDPRRTGVMICVPLHPVYTDAIVQCGAVKVECPLDEENGWALDVREIRRSLYKARTHCTPKVLCIANPGNPTGHVQSRKCIEEVIQLAADENLLLFVDEMNQDAVFAPGFQFRSFKKVLFEMGPPYSEEVQLISFHSISNTVFGEGGLRGAYFEFINIDEEVMECIYANVFFWHPPALGMIVLDLMLHPPMPGDPSHYTFVSEKKAVLHKLAMQARLAEEILNIGSGIYCKAIQGAMHAFPRIEIPDNAVKMAQTQGLEPDVFFCRQLLDKTGIIVAPGSDFGQAEGTHHIRITLFEPLEKLKTVLTSIKDFHKTFLQEYS